jgi:hypothetical protein
MKKTVLLATGLVLFMSACSNSNDTNTTPQMQTKQPLPKVSDDNIKTLAKSLVLMDVVQSKASKKPQSTRSRAINDMPDNKMIENCQNGGTIEFVMPSPPDPATYDPQTFDLDNYEMNTTIIYKDCLEGGMLTDGTMQDTMTFKNGQPGGDTMTFVTDFITQYQDGNATIKKGSYIITEMISEETMITTENIDAYFDGQHYQTKAFKNSDTMLQNGGLSSYPISGATLVNGHTYTVDPAYNASKTPMVMDGNFDMISGKERYIDEQNSTITLEVVGKNQMKLSLDTDHDGKADEEEILAL